MRSSGLVQRMLGARHRLAPYASAAAMLVLLGLWVVSLRHGAAADDVVGNVRAIADAVRRHQAETGGWFPERWLVRRDGSPGTLQIYPDVFARQPLEYPGLESELFDHDANHGIVLQLVRFGPTRDLGAGAGLLRPPLRSGDPYLRFLLDYGPTLADERALMAVLVDRLGAHRFTRVEDHLYVMDLRPAP